MIFTNFLSERLRPESVKKDQKNGGIAKKQYSCVQGRNQGGGG